MKKEIAKDIAIIFLFILVLLLFAYILFQKHGLKMYNQGINDGIINLAREQTKTGYIYVVENNSLKTISISEICYRGLENQIETQQNLNQS